MFNLFLILIIVFLIILFNIRIIKQRENYVIGFKKSNLYHLNLEFNLNDQIDINLHLCDIKRQIKKTLINEKILKNNYPVSNIKIYEKYDILHVTLLLVYNKEQFKKIKRMDKYNIRLKLNPYIYNLSKFYFYTSNKQIISVLEKLEQNLKSNKTISNIYNKPIVECETVVDDEPVEQIEQKSTEDKQQVLELVVDDADKKELIDNWGESKGIFGKTERVKRMVKLKKKYPLLRFNSKLMEVLKLLKPNTTTITTRLGEDFDIRVFFTDDTWYFKVEDSETTIIDDDTIANPDINVKIGDHLLFNGTVKDTQSFAIKDSNDEDVILPTNTETFNRIFKPTVEGTYTYYNKTESLQEGQQGEIIVTVR